MDLSVFDDFLLAPERFLFHEPSGTAVLSDLHLGVEAEVRAGGGMMPDFSGGVMAGAWKKILERSPKRIVVAGDLFDSEAPGREVVEQARGLFAMAGCEVVVVPGNHDPLPAVMMMMDFRVEPGVFVGEWLVVHGHDLSRVPAPRPGLIVGHQHPAVVLGDGVRSEKMICFALIERPRMIVLPAFSVAPLGVNLLSRSRWILDCAPPAVGDVRVAGIVGDRVLDFGTLEAI